MFFMWQVNSVQHLLDAFKDDKKGWTQHFEHDQCDGLEDLPTRPNKRSRQ